MKNRDETKSIYQEYLDDSYGNINMVFRGDFIVVLEDI